MAVGPCKPWQGMPSSVQVKPHCLPAPAHSRSLPKTGRRGCLPFVLLPRLFLATLFHCKLSLLL